MTPTIESNPSYHARAQREPIAQLHRLLLSLFGSGEQFRHWIALGPCGQKLITELPERPASTAAALLDGLDILMRRGHVDAEFFIRLAEEFPLRADEVSRVFTSWRPHVPTPARQSQRGRVLPKIAVMTVPLALALVCQASGARTTPQVLVLAEDTTIDAHVDYIFIPPCVDCWPPKKPGASKVPPKRPVGGVTAEPHVLSPSTTRPHTACEFPPDLVKNLGELARANISNPAVTERFTVVLRAHADAADVSPRPLPGQTALRIHERLTRLGPEAFGQCREIPVDITFSYRRATLRPRLP